MLRTLFFFLKLAILLAVAVWLAERPGQVSLVWLGYRIDTSVGILLAAVLVVAVVVALVYRLWRFLVRSPQQIARSRHEKRRRQGYRALTQGMVAVAAGDAAEARRQSKKAELLLEEPPLTLLLAAQAAQLNGDEAAATRYFESMLERPETAFLGVRGLLTQALRSGDDRAALGYAGRALAERPNTAWAAEALLDLQLRAGQWQAAAVTLKQAKRLGVVDDAKAHRIRAVILTEEARVEAADHGDGAPPRALAALEEAVRLAPGLVPARALWAELLARAGKRRHATKIVERAWAEAPHPLLAAAYAKIEPAESPLERARRFEALAARNPQPAESHRAAGQAALAAGLWGEARRHFAAALERAGGDLPTVGFAHDMARLEESENGDAAAARGWLLRAAEAPADPAWICAKCSQASRGWRALCPHCSAFDSLEWRSAPRPVATLLPPGGAFASQALVPLAPTAEVAPPSPPLPPSGAKGSPASAVAAAGGYASSAAPSPRQPLPPPVDAARLVN